MTKVLGHSGTSAFPSHHSHVSGRDDTRVHDTITNGLTLQGTGGAIQGVGLLEPCRPDTQFEELRKRLTRDGVVWVCNRGDSPPTVRRLIGEVSTSAYIQAGR